MISLFCSLIALNLLWLIVNASVLLGMNTYYTHEPIVDQCGHMLPVFSSKPSQRHIDDINPCLEMNQIWTQ